MIMRLDPSVADLRRNLALLVQGEESYLSSQTSSKRESL